jgi:hypothetical protein
LTVRSGLAVLIVPLSLQCVTAASAEKYTADPGAWRPGAYSDLLFPSGEAEAYASIWRDRLAENNQTHLQSESRNLSLNMSIVVGNRGAAEWHYSINFETKLVALTVLDAPSVCTDEYASPLSSVRIKVCPMRLVSIENDHYSIVNGAACYLEKEHVASTEDSTAIGVYAAYDIATRSIKLRYVVAHQEISQCAQTVPLHREFPEK